MTVTRSLPVTLLLALAACASSSQRGQAPRPARGDDGPGATISVMYSGGIITREVTASFSVSRPSFVVVGHLGGDGLIRVLHPSMPNRFEVTEARHRYRTQPFFAGYDGAPSLYSFTLSPYRNAGARFDSYDGRGYGFVFIVASNYPMRMDSFSDGFEWVDLDVQDYFRTTDPRVAIQEFAERLTGGRAYTLKFARSSSTQDHSSLAALSYDCAVLSSLGHLYHYRFWNSWGLFGPRVTAFDNLSPRNIYPYANRFSNGCGPRHYASYNGYGRYGYAWGPTYNPYTPYTPRVGTPPTTGPITPVLTRPTQRAFGERAGTLAQSELTRRANDNRNSRRAIQEAHSARQSIGARYNGRDLDRGRSAPPSSGTARSSGVAASARDAASTARASTPSTSTRSPSAPAASSGAAASARSAAAAARNPTP